MDFTESRGLLCHHRPPILWPPAALMAISVNYLEFLVFTQKAVINVQCQVYGCVPPDSSTLPLIFQSVCFLWYRLWFLFSTVWAVLFRKLGWLVVFFPGRNIFSVNVNLVTQSEMFLFLCFYLSPANFQLLCILACRRHNGETKWVAFSLRLTYSFFFAVGYGWSTRWPDWKC